MQTATIQQAREPAFPSDNILDFPQYFADWGDFTLPIDGQEATITIQGRQVMEVMS